MISDFWQGISTWFYWDSLFGDIEKWTATLTSGRKHPLSQFHFVRLFFWIWKISLKRNYKRLWIRLRVISGNVDGFFAFFQIFAITIFWIQVLNRGKYRNSNQNIFVGIDTFVSSLVMKVRKRGNEEIYVSLERGII